MVNFPRQLRPIDDQGLSQHLARQREKRLVTDVVPTQVSIFHCDTGKSVAMWLSLNNRLRTNTRLCFPPQPP